MCYTLLRHSIALGIILFSYKYLKEKNIFKFIFAIIIASLFHKTAIIFLIAYPVYNMLKFGNKNYVIIVLALCISILFGNQLLNFVIKILNEDRFSSYADAKTSLNLTNFYINVLVLLFTNIYYFVFYTKDSKKTKEINGLMNLSTISCVFLAFTPVLGEMYRISMFFGIFNIILVPNIIYEANKDSRYRPMIYYILYTILILYYLFFAINNALVNPYIFFWNN